MRKEAKAASSAQPSLFERLPARPAGDRGEQPRYNAEQGLTRMRTDNGAAEVFAEIDAMTPTQARRTVFELARLAISSRSHAVLRRLLNWDSARDHLDREAVRTLKQCQQELGSIDTKRVFEEWTKSLEGDAAFFEL